MIQLTLKSRIKKYTKKCIKAFMKTMDLNLKISSRLIDNRLILQDTASQWKSKIIMTLLLLSTCPNKDKMKDMTLKSK